MGEYLLDDGSNNFLESIWYKWGSNLYENNNSPILVLYRNYDENGRTDTWYVCNYKYITDCSDYYLAMCTINNGTESANPMDCYPWLFRKWFNDDIFFNGSISHVIDDNSSNNSQQEIASNIPRVFADKDFTDTQQVNTIIGFYNYCLHLATDFCPKCNQPGTIC